MSKRILFAICFVLVVGTVGPACLGTPIDVNNFSFEYDVNGNQIYCHTGIESLIAWQQNGSAWSGVDPYCLGDANYDPCAIPANICYSEECYTDDHQGCHCWPATHGIVYCYLQATGGSDPTFLYQNLDPNDPDAKVALGRKYILTFDAMSEIYGGVIDHIYTVPVIYYGDGGGDHTKVAEKAFVLPTWIGDLNEWEHEWEPNLTLAWVATEDNLAAVGQTLGLRWHAPSPSGGSVRAYIFTENVRFEWVWASDAFDPKPPDDSEDVARDVNLAWSPGLWADQHIVYFHEDYNMVATRHEDANKGLQEPNTFDPTPMDGQLDLGKTYYWRVVEVNDEFIDPYGGVPDPPWYGDVWSFTVTGYATNPNPPDGQRNVPFIGTTLSWTPGTDSNSHDVYFGTDSSAVADATTSSPEFMINKDVNNYDPGEMLFGQKYYWRIDEVNEAAGSYVKGDVWSFTVAMYYPVDEFETYANTDELEEVWNDYYVNDTGSDIYIETEPNYVEEGSSMEYIYENDNSYYGYYSEAYADLDDLEIMKNWTYSGLEVLTLSFMGKEGNALDDMYVALTDGGNRTGKVLYPDVNELAIGWTGFRQWNIELSEFVEANSVDITDIDRITIGFGDKTPGGTGIVYFDNIRLYPPRCVPKYAFAEGNFDGDENCEVDNSDLELLAERDWLVSAIGDVTAAAPNNASSSLLGWWPLDDNISSGPSVTLVVDISGNNRHGQLHDPGGDPGEKTSLHHDSSCVEGTGALTFDGYDDYVEIPALNINTNTITLTAWVKRDGSPNIYAGILFSSSAYPEPNDPCEITYTCGLEMGADTNTWLPNNELAYMWTGYAWEWHTGLFVPPDEWCFTALTVAPDVGTLYLYDGEMKAARNYDTHEKRYWDAPVRIGDQMQFGPEGERIFKGSIDDVRIYNYTLTPAEILSVSLLGGSGSTYLELPNWRADADGDDKIDFRDFGIMADNWLQEVRWP